MEKEYIRLFLSQKRRGVYKLIVSMYSDIIISMPLTLALEVISQDLCRGSDLEIKLNYNSFVHAVSKSRKKNLLNTTTAASKWSFKDANETVQHDPAPGRFKTE